MTMRKFKKAVCVIAAAAMTLCLSSCMAMENGLVLSGDCETVTLYTETALEKDYLTQMEMTEEDFYSTLDESNGDTYADWELEDKEITKNDKEYISRRYSKNYTYEALMADEEIRQSSDSTYTVDYKIEKTDEEINVTVTYTYIGEPVEETEEMDDMGITNEFKITAPFELLETNGETESEYSKDTEGSQTVVVWDVSGVSMGSETEKVISAKFALPKDGSFLVAAIIIAAVVIIAIVAVVLVFVTKKNNEIPEAAADFSAQETEESISVREETAQTEAEAVIPVQTEAPAEEAKRPAYCEICGMKLSEDDKFCPGCGEKI